MNPERIAEIRAAEQAATPGPWRLTGGHIVLGKRAYVVVIQRKCSLQRHGADGCLNPPLSSDWHFIALAREVVPELLAEVERLQEQRDECRANYKREVDNLTGWIAQLEAALTHATAKEEHFEIQAVAAANLRAREAKHG